MTTTLHTPDAVWCCLYRWIQHNGELDKVTLIAAMKLTLPGTPLRDIIHRLEALRGANMLVADDIGRLRGLLSLERDPELWASLLAEKHHAETALLRNIATTASL